MISEAHRFLHCTILRVPNEDIVHREWGLNIACKVESEKTIPVNFAIIRKISCDKSGLTSQQFLSVSYTFNSQNQISGRRVGSTVFGRDLHLSHVLHWTHTRSSSGGPADASWLLLAADALLAAAEDFELRPELVAVFSCSTSMSSSSAPWEDSAPWALLRFRSLWDFGRPWFRMLASELVSYPCRCKVEQNFQDCTLLRKLRNFVSLIAHHLIIMVGEWRSQYRYSVQSTTEGNVQETLCVCVCVQLCVCSTCVLCVCFRLFLTNLAGFWVLPFFSKSCPENNSCLSSLGRIFLPGCRRKPVLPDSGHISRRR